jgi:hypothetical protein
MGVCAELADFGTYGAKCNVTKEQQEETTSKIWVLGVIMERLLAIWGAGVQSRPHSRNVKD